VIDGLILFKIRICITLLSGDCKNPVEVGGAWPGLQGAFAYNK